MMLLGNRFSLEGKQVSLTPEGYVAENLCGFLDEGVIKINNTGIVLWSTPRGILPRFGMDCNVFFPEEQLAGLSSHNCHVQWGSPMYYRNLFIRKNAEEKLYFTNHTSGYAAFSPLFFEANTNVNYGCCVTDSRTAALQGVNGELAEAKVSFSNDETFDVVSALATPNVMGRTLIRSMRVYHGKVEPWWFRWNRAVDLQRFGGAA